MKYLKTFEGRESSDYTKRTEYKYLTTEEDNLLNIFISDYIKKLNILDKIDSLTLSEIEQDGFEYRTIFNNLIGINNSYSDKNSFYNNIDKFIKEKNINSSTQVNRNSIFKIEDKIYKSYKPDFVDKLDNKIIEVVSNFTDLSKFKEYYKKNSDNFSSNVKKELSYILNADKFNI